MRFLMLNWRDPENPRAGGAERVTLAYWSALAQRGHDAHWCAYSFPGAVPHATLDGVHIHRGGVSTLGARRMARRWAQEHGPFDLIVDQHHGLPWFAHRWRQGRTISYIHEVLGPIWSSFYPWPLSWCGRAMESVTHRLFRAQPFWTGCQATKTQLEARGIRRIKVVSYGIETEVLNPLPPKSVEEPIRLLVVCRLAPNKRVDHAIDAVGHLAEIGRHAELRIVGGGDEESKLRKRVEAAGLGDRVHFLGRVSEERKLDEMRRASFLVHTSVREGWGLNVVEANAMGTPAVVYPVAGLTESTVHGKTGWVVSRETPASLAEGIAEASSHESRYQEWREAGRDRARALHWRNIAPRAADWLESLASGAPFEAAPLEP